MLLRPAAERRLLAIDAGAQALDFRAGQWANLGLAPGARKPYSIASAPGQHGIEFLMEHRHLWVRTPRQAAILRIRAEIIKAARDFFDERGFVLTDPPILTPAACEGTTTLFPVDYFEEQAFLTQSGQLYMACWPGSPISSKSQAQGMFQSALR